MGFSKHFRILSPGNVFSDEVVEVIKDFKVFLSEDESSLTPESFNHKNILPRVSSEEASLY